MANDGNLTFHDPNSNYMGANIHHGDAEEDSARGTPLKPMTPEEIQTMLACGHF